MDIGLAHSSLKAQDYNRISRRTSAHKELSPEKRIFSGNFTPSHKTFVISQDRARMRRDIMETLMKRTENVMGDGHRGDKIYVDDNPVYEDPRDVIGDKPPKPPRKRNFQQNIVTSSPRSKERSQLKEQRKKLTKKYEGLISALIDRCEDNVLQISERDSQITKLKDKLKSVLEYNKLFAEENDQLKAQYGVLVKYVDECKEALKVEREKYKVMEDRNKDLEEKIRKYEIPAKEQRVPSTAIPLVEVCMSCSSRQIIFNQAREHNARLQKDMHALKDVLYRLNVQLSRYQEKLRSNVQSMTTNTNKDEGYKPGDRYEGLDSLLGTGLGCNYNRQETGNTEVDHNGQPSDLNQMNASKVADLSGLLSAQALAPLFDAYQENLQEKDSLIVDYEKQFENINKKSKLIVEENKSLSEKVQFLEQELGQMKQVNKKLMVDKETTDIEKATLVERAERAESKLKEVYELYEDKMQAMMRDYETVHREYFSVKSALEASEGKLAQVDVMRARTVPADLHERRLDHCKRLLEELKHQYSMESERKTEHVKKIEEQLKLLEEKHNKLSKEHELAQTELKAALKNVRLYRKAAVIFRARLQSAKARMTKVRRSAKGRNSEPLRVALTTLDRIKGEIKVVKTKAHSSLDQLERRIVEQERSQAEYRRELERAALALQHKEAIIRSLIDKVADVEEVRLSQTNTHRLQGIVSDSDESPSPKELERKHKTSVKLVPGSGGYFQEKEGKRKGKS